ncbi:hypothetical protein FRC09_016673 [Ceratobasidium sp. 395]|nr:hypothetical protein FRC09_016673 [Ceratobasidium sp. 395]
MRARAEDAGTHRATVAMLRAEVVFCTEGIVEDVGSEQNKEALRNDEAEQAQPSTAPPPKAYPPTPHQSSTPSVCTNRVRTELYPTPPRTRSLPWHHAIYIFGQCRVDSPAGCQGAYHTRPQTVEHESEVCLCGIWTGEEKCGGVGSRKEAPTVDRLGVQGESEEEEMPDTCPCMRTFILPAPLNSRDKLMVRTTHPRVMLELAFLMSIVSRRDVIVRKPRRMVFAVEGLRVSEESGIDVASLVCAILQDMKRTGLQLAEIRVDLLCELVATPMTPPEFDRLAELIAHARDFLRLNSRYIVHTSLTLEDAGAEWFRVTSLAVAKEQLKLALDGATRAQYNYMRALALAMSASHYMHTAETHAGTMFGIVKQLAVGMGAVEKGKEGENGKKGNGSMGNAPLGCGLG